LSETSPEEAQTPKHDPFAAFRYPAFVLFTGSRVFSTIGNSLLQMVMLWQVYEVSDSTLALGGLGLVRFIPALGFALIGGAAADTYNRRTIICVAQSVPLTCSIVLAVATAGGWVSLELIYGLVLLLALSAAFEGPARSAILPAIVPAVAFTNAVTIGTTIQSLGAITGPALGGGIIALAGPAVAYATYGAIACASITLLLLLRFEQHTEAGRSVSLAMIKEGILFVRSRQVLLGSMTLDMFGVVLGGATALLPVFAKDILDSGASGFGMLAASFQAGAFAMSFCLVMRRPVRRTGRTLMLAVVLFGIGTIVFGLSRNFYLSLLAYMFVGAADQLSVVMRHTTLQLATPDELRGRVTAVSQVFIGASNQLNAVYSGSIASLTSATFAVVSGGVGTLAVVGGVAATLRQLWRYEIPLETRSEPAETSAAPRPAREEAPASTGS
jgi:MFS family permease